MTGWASDSESVVGFGLDLELGSSGTYRRRRTYETVTETGRPPTDTATPVQSGDSTFSRLVLATFVVVALPVCFSRLALTLASTAVEQSWKSGYFLATVYVPFTFEVTNLKRFKCLFQNYPHFHFQSYKS